MKPTLNVVKVVSIDGMENAQHAKYVRVSQLFIPLSKKMANLLKVPTCISD